MSSLPLGGCLRPFIGVGMLAVVVLGLLVVGGMLLAGKARAPATFAPISTDEAAIEPANPPCAPAQASDPVEASGTVRNGASTPGTYRITVEIRLGDAVVDRPVTTTARIPAGADARWTVVSFATAGRAGTVTCRVATVERRPG